MDNLARSAVVEYIWPDGRYQPRSYRGARPPTAVKAHCCQPGTHRSVRSKPVCLPFPAAPAPSQDPALVVTLDGVGCQDVGQGEKASVL